MYEPVSLGYAQVHPSKSPPESASDLPPGWVVRTSQRFPNTLYYFNTVTAETSWNPPEHLSENDSDYTEQDEEFEAKIELPSPAKSRKNSVVQFNPVKSILKPVRKLKKHRPTRPSFRKVEHNRNGRSILALRQPLSPSSSPPSKFQHNSASSASVPESRYGMDYDDPEMMDIDMTDVSNEIREILHRPMHSETNEQALHIVVDTNILIHNLSFLDDLKDTPLEGYGLPVIVVPWVVFQELDAIKKRPDGQYLVFEAIRYLHKKLIQNHPRVKGQVESQDSTDYYSAPESNDDRILQCVMQLASRIGFNLVFFLSNDKNFVSKAIIQGIKANTIASFLEQFPPNLMVKSIIKPVGFASHCALPEDQKHGLTTSQNLDVLICQAKALIKNALVNLVESEMKAVYDDTWLDIVYNKPPWSLLSVLDNIKRHWSSVFSFCMTSTVQYLINKAIQQLKNNRDKAYSKKEGLTLLELFMGLCLEMHKRNETCQHELFALQSLISQLKSKPKKEAISYFDTPQVDPMADENEQESDQRVLSCFQVVWYTINNLTGCLLHTLEQQHNQFEFVPPTRTISKKECLDFLPKLYPVLTHLKQSMQHVIVNRDPKSPDHKKSIKELYRQMKSALPNLAVNSVLPAAFTMDELSLFCVKDEHLELLNNGYAQIRDFVKLVYECLCNMS